MVGKIAVLALSIAVLGGGFVACSDHDDSDTEGQRLGQVELALTGEGSLGGQYRLTDATFSIEGPVSEEVDGDPDTVIRTLPIGSYTVELEAGWTLLRLENDGSTEEVTATLASANPRPFIINGAQTTSVEWQFNVSGDNPDADDYEVVIISNGAVELTLDSVALGWANFSTGDGHSCAITTLGNLKCWGYGTFGQLGYGTTTSLAEPSLDIVNVGDGRTVKRVEAARSGNFTCALLDDNTVKCWGDNAYGQLGYGNTTDQLSPPGPVINLGSSNTAKSVYTGQQFTCVILDSNQVKCWGRASNGQLGYGGSTTSVTAPPADPIDLGAGTGAISMATGLLHACALLSDGTVKCWGSNTYGQLGYGDTTQRTTPGGVIDLGTDRTAKRITAGDNHTCAILDDDSVKCWGYNNRGQLGYGDVVNRTSPPATPVNLGEGRTAQRITAGEGHTCAILDDDSVKCWGYNNRGQLGYEDTNQRSAPAAVVVNLGSGRTATRLLASDDHTCALLDDNGLKCWGYNYSNVFGIGRDANASIGDVMGEMGNGLPEVLP